MLLNPIQRLKQRNHILLIRLLRRGKPGLVHPVIDLVIVPLVGLVNLLPQILRVQVELFGILVVQKVIKLRVEHAQDLAALVVDDGLRLLVVQHGHGETPRVGRVGLVVDVAEVGEGLVAGYGVGDDVL
jgi:hypothetical protein